MANQETAKHLSTPNTTRGRSTAPMRALRDRRLDELEQLIEEVEDVGGALKRSVRSHDALSLSISSSCSTRRHKIDAWAGARPPDPAK